MCGPAIPIAMAALAVASTANSIYQTNKAAKQQAEVMNDMADNEREEIQAAAQEEMGERVRLAREARARARVAAGESGAMGQSFAAMINQSIQDQDESAGLVAKNASLQKRAVDDRLKTSLSQIRTVSSTEAGLQLASSAVGGYNSGLSIKGKMGSKPAAPPG